MDGQIRKAENELDTLLKATAAAASEVQRLRQERNIPHYSVIEQEAHRIGTKLSCLIQQRRANEVASSASTTAECPGCGKICEVEHKTRSVGSIDGEVEFNEPRASCSRCERLFFPSTDNTRI